MLMVVNIAADPKKNVNASYVSKARGKVLEKVQFTSKQMLPYLHLQ